ncbi:MAG: glycosyltransferase family 4 protein [bacterium]|nr:glycosyltransferase family 4 protein [bacterium]
MVYITNQRMPTEKAYGIQIAKTCEAFASFGVDVDLIAPFRISDIKDDFFDYYSVKKIFRFKKIFSPDFYLPGILDKVAFVIKNFVSAMVLAIYALFLKSDVIYSRDEPVIFFLSFLVKPQRLVFEAHKFPRSRTFFYRRFKKKNLKIVTISHGLEGKFIELGFKPENILVAPDGVDINKFDIVETKEWCREKLDLPQNKKIILYAGHLFEWKGVDTLLLAAEYLGDDCLIIVVGGTDTDLKKYQLRLNNNQFKNRIKTLGHRAHKLIPLFLKAADVLVLPNSGKETVSYSFTSPLKLFEYMASKRPIVASDLISIREVLDENSAVLVKPDDSLSLAEGIKIVLGDNILSDRISNNAFEKVQRYSWSNRAENILSLINKK